jgi:inhibitor of cysteine peptidase
MMGVTMMKKAFFILSLTVFVFLGTTACTPAPLTPGATAHGKSITIILQENPTTGYTWSIAIDNKDILALASDKYTPTPTDAKIVGSGGLHTYVFQTKKPGTALITFDLGQQWDGGQKGAQTQKYQITVGQDGNASSKEIQ